MAVFDWNSTPGCISGIKNAEGVATIKCLEPLFKNIASAVFSLAGVALFIMLVVGGFNFLFAGGDQKKLESAKNTVTYAIVGLVVIVVAYLIIRLITSFTGVDVTKFVIPQ